MKRRMKRRRMKSRRMKSRRMKRGSMILFGDLPEIGEPDGREEMRRRELAFKDYWSTSLLVNLSMCPYSTH